MSSETPRPIEKIVMSDKYALRVEVDLGKNYVIEQNEDGKTYIVYKHALPTNTYECRQLLGIDDSRQLTYVELSFYEKLTDYEKERLIRLNAFNELLICRDAFWKALEWTPDWNNANIVKHVLYYHKGRLETNLSYTARYILAFPDEKSLALFKEMFIERIEKCEEFL